MLVGFILECSCRHVFFVHVNQPIVNPPIGHGSFQCVSFGMHSNKTTFNSFTDNNRTIMVVAGTSYGLLGSLVDHTGPHYSFA